MTLFDCASVEDVAQNRKCKFLKEILELSERNSYNVIKNVQVMTGHSRLYYVT